MATATALAALLLLMALGAAPPCAAGNLETDKVALLAFKGALEDATALEHVYPALYDDHAPWLAWSSDTLPCTLLPSGEVQQWVGVGCSAVDGALRVTNLTLQYDETGESELDAGLSAPLQGPLTSALSGLEELLSLHLAGNDFTTPLPEDFVNTGIVEVRVPYNGITGPLPASWSTLERLQLLDLSSQPITGGIPPEWASLPSLDTLYLGSTNVSDPLDAAASMRALDTLDLSGCADLTGTFPDSWSAEGAFPRLKYLYVDRASLSGMLPAAWGHTSMPNIEVLRLGVNKLSGELPSNWGQKGAFTKLTFLDVADNHLTGLLPDAWGAEGAFPLLEDLELGVNGLTGTLPASWAAPGSFPKLGSLYLGNNPGLEGTIPSSWGTKGNLASLQTLVLKPDTGLCGTVPQGLEGKVQSAEYSREWQSYSFEEVDSLGPC